MANKELRAKIREAYDTEANWIANDPVLLSGQLAFSSDKYGKYKIGDGIKTWKQLEYATLSWNEITGKPSTFNPNQHNHTISQITDIGNASVKHANTAGSANAVAWANVSGKPSTFNPATHNHDDRYYTETEMNAKLGEKSNVGHSHTKTQVGLGNVDNTADSNKNVNSAKYIRDSNNGANIAISYQDNALTTASWFPAFANANKIGTIGGSNLRNAIGAAEKNHKHDSGVCSINEKSNTGTRYVKIADLECTAQYQRLNQQIIFTTREESILINVRCSSSNNTIFSSPAIRYVALSSSPNSIVSNLSAGLINVTTSKNKIEIWYKQVQYSPSLNIIPVGRNKENASLNFYAYDSTAAGSTTTPTFTTNIPISSAITWNEVTGKPTSMPASDVASWAKASTKPTYTKAEIGLGSVDNTADANKSVKYATSAGSATNATTATKLGTATKGSATQPIYLNAGVPTACTYTLGKSVPSNAVFTDTNTWIALKGATTTAAGTAGYAPAPSAGAANRYLRSDGTWAVPPDTNTTYGVVSTTANGLAPKRDGSTAHFLRGDGTWATPPNTTYSVASGSTNGLMSSTDKTKLDGIATGANKYVLPTAGLNALGGVKTTSQVTSSSGYTACPIIGGVPYYKDTNTTYTLGSFGITATAAELNFCDGVTSNIQTQLNGKAPSGHSHSASQITGLPNVVAITNSQIDSLKNL